ncbi:pyridoxamine 5'-phosphate oxidase family protein [Streptomyces cupreus]|uniref:Pyridoxamine 5'-phosphate oxidase family protein n=1 Tax=Streptomyces cupreus TaxID=2759956 RepID=A0A7X1MFQ2_9ACTN|nr:pyridoxamine 5'-phosphate oxidase family protein [Streptomyces cupreus]MBC2906940.1 pyridoxamine 5'-phosphate oxidase family protein [Streptomyces cupreus]
MTAGPAARMVDLEREESLKLLAGAPMGRVGFTHQALPVIRPVNHLVNDDGDIVIRTHAGAALLATASASEVVVYEAELTPWIGAEMENVVLIRAELVTGYRLVRRGGG